MGREARDTLAAATGEVEEGLSSRPSVKESAEIDMPIPSSGENLSEREAARDEEEEEKEEEEEEL